MFIPQGGGGPRLFQVRVRETLSGVGPFSSKIDGRVCSPGRGQGGWEKPVEGPGSLAGGGGTEHPCSGKCGLEKSLAARPVGDAIVFLFAGLHLQERPCGNLDGPVVVDPGDVALVLRMIRQPQQGAGSSGSLMMNGDLAKRAHLRDIAGPGVVSPEPGRHTYPCLLILSFREHRDCSPGSMGRRAVCRQLDCETSRRREHGAR